MYQRSRLAHYDYGVPDHDRLRAVLDRMGPRYYYGFDLHFDSHPELKKLHMWNGPLSSALRMLLGSVSEDHIYTAL